MLLKQCDVQRLCTQIIKAFSSVVCQNIYLSLYQGIPWLEIGSHLLSGLENYTMGFHGKKKRKEGSSQNESMVQANDP